MTGTSDVMSRLWGWSSELAVRSRLGGSFRKAVGGVLAGCMVLGVFLHLFAAGFLSPVQEQDYALGRYRQSFEVSLGACHPTHDCPLSQEVFSLARNAGAVDAALRLQLSGVRFDGGEGEEKIADSEWGNGNRTGPETLMDGRWPQKPGEIVVTKAVNKGIGSTISVYSGSYTMTVVGVIEDPFYRNKNIVLAGKGTVAEIYDTLIRRGDRFLKPSVRVTLWSTGADSTALIDQLATKVAQYTHSDPGISLKMIREGFTERDDSLQPSWDEYLTRLPVITGWAILVAVPFLFAGIASLTGLKPWRRSVEIAQSLGLRTGGLKVKGGLAVLLGISTASAVGTALGYAGGFLFRPLLAEQTGRVLSPPLSPLPVVAIAFASSAAAAIVVGAAGTVGSRVLGSTRLREFLRWAGKLLFLAGLGFAIASVLRVPSQGASDGVLLWILSACLLAGVICGMASLAYQDSSGRLPLPIMLALRKLRAQGPASLLVFVAVFSSVSLPLSNGINTATGETRESLRAVSPVPTGHVVLGQNFVYSGGISPTILSSFEEYTGLKDPVWVRQALMSTGELLQGLPLAVDSAEDIETIIGRPLTTEQRAAFKAGGLLVANGPTNSLSTGDMLPTTGPSGKDTGKVRVTLLEGVPEGYRFGLLGYVSTATAKKAGWPLNNGYAIYTNVYGPALESAVRAPKEKKFDTSAVEVYREVRPGRLPLSMRVMQGGMLVLVALLALLVSLRHVRESRAFAKTLETVGMKSSAASGVVLVMMAVNVLLPIVLGHAAAVFFSAFALNSLLKDKLGATIPWDDVWLSLGFSLLFVSATVAVTMSIAYRKAGHSAKVLTE